MRALFLVLIVLGVLSGASAQNFNPPVWIAGGPGQTRPRLAAVAAERVAEGGRLHIAWAERDTDGLDTIRYTVEREAFSGIFRTPLTVDRMTTGTVLAVDVFGDPTGRGHVAWTVGELEDPPLRYAAVQNGVVLERSTVEERGGTSHVAVRAFALEANGQASPLVFNGRNVYRRPLLSGWTRVWGASRFDAEPGFETGSVRGGLLNLVRVPDTDKVLISIGMSELLHDPETGFSLETWRGLSRPFEDPTDIMFASQSIGATTDMVGHVVLRERFPDKPSISWYVQIGLRSTLGYAQFREIRLPEAGTLTSLSFYPDPRLNLFDRPLALGSVSGGTAHAGFNNGGLSSSFEFPGNNPRDITGFSLQPMQFDTGPVAGEPRLAPVIHQGVRRLRVLVASPTDGSLWLWNETGLPMPPATPTPTPSPVPTATPAPTTTPVVNWIGVLDAVLSKGRTPTPSEFQQGDANADSLWDAADIVRLRGGRP